MDRRTAPCFGQYLSAFAAQLVHACPDHSKIVGGAGSGALATQLLDASPDHRKIVSDAGSSSCFLWFLVILIVSYPAAAIGSLRPGALFLTLPTIV